MPTILKFYCVLIMVLAVGCASNPKHKSTPDQIENLNALVMGKSFEINANWARPMATRTMNAIGNAGLIPPGSTLNRIDITGTASYLRVLGDSVKAQLPYYGERQMGGVYNLNKIGIQFEGIPEDFSIISDSKSEAQIMDFSITEDGESFRVTALLYPSLSSTITIVSSHRNTIWYSGYLSEYVPEASGEVEK
ncbi:DUF4251 domain-containing protein [Flagellimonas nanhaiensis]|uniref:DUF4251 domain-containing protein n=1 Tax=Flagellimonas nanhaiensis TaxID=2292706 RepID=A0A371JUL4_9FLAO|nr:DUF4251 domain-containing protein [Allomuricauda nanhaiensis]RDY61508.1 DUF4251 domain-containing protein [Allomuricauda nanhaiensis]